LKRDTTPGIAQTLLTIAVLPFKQRLTNEVIVITILFEKTSVWTSMPASQSRVLVVLRPYQLRVRHVAGEATDP
jgi:hypothetical protein